MQRVRVARVALMAAAGFACVAAFSASEAQAGDFKRAFHDELGRIAAHRVVQIGHAVAFGPPVVVKHVGVVHAKPQHRRGWHRPAKRHHWKRHHPRRHYRDRGCGHAVHRERGYSERGHRRGGERRFRH